MNATIDHINLRKPITPIMTAGEFRLFLDTVRSARSYLEFGMGGSTIAALKSPIQRLYAVESSREWLEYVRADPDFRPRADQDVLLHYADIGPVREGGWPIGDGKLWPAYNKEIWRLIDPFEIDAVLVDGRFRVSCALETILRCKSSVKIMMHDWDRTFYHVILQHADLISHVDKMVVLAPKKLQYRSAIEALIHTKQSDPS